jgi:cation diffusion facilitator CzcD-associated flavoprotein CzcO
LRIPAWRIILCQRDLSCLVRNLARIHKTTLSAGSASHFTRDYKSQVPPGRVLVVGDGATGRQLAVELMATHDVLLATGRPRRASLERILGKSIFWWMDRLGVLGATRESRIGRYLLAADPFPGKALDPLEPRCVRV